MWELDKPTFTVKNFAQAESAITQLLERQDLGFFNISLLEKGAIASAALAAQLAPDYDQVAILGIGGSSLGTQALVEALSPESIENGRIVFFDNVDSKSFFRKLEYCGPKTLWVLISKSGTTIETLSQAEYIDQYLKQEGRPQLCENAVVITENKASALFDWAQKHKLPMLEVPLSVGGRFSVLTPVGLFPAAVLGISGKEILAGAQNVLQEQLNIKSLVAQFLASWDRGEHTTYFFHYCDDLKFFGLWIQQLWAESLGKKQTLANEEAPPVSVPMACRGSTDQHSVLQQIAEGTQKKFVCFLRVKESENFGQTLNSSLFSKNSLMLGKSLGQLLGAEAQATQEALSEAQVQSLTLTAEKLTERSVGALLFTFEMVVGALGMAKNINPFDQPGVERGKILTRSILSR
jgi:glucose-6-phosphate isomerase